MHPRQTLKRMPYQTRSHQLNKRQAMIYRTYIQTPVGEMMAGATDKGICLFDFRYRANIANIMARVQNHLDDTFSDGWHSHFDVLSTQIGEYFEGARKEFDLPLTLAGSAFQVAVWEALLTIPYGQTTTYGRQAKLIQATGAIRAVAAANGANGLAIIVPCHRVIAENGDLTGYSGGVVKKRWLLHHEQKGLARQGELF